MDESITHRSVFKIIIKIVKYVGFFKSTTTRRSFSLCAQLCACMYTREQVCAVYVYVKNACAHKMGYLNVLI